MAQERFVMANFIFSAEDNRLLHKSALLLSCFRDVSPTMNTQVASVFVLCALTDGASVNQIAKMSGISLSTISRNILDLGPVNRKREPGYGLLSTIVDPMDFRKKVITLTPKGRELVTKILSTYKA